MNSNLKKAKEGTVYGRYTERLSGNSALLSNSSGGAFTALSDDFLRNRNV